MDVKAEHFERQVARVEAERDAMEKKVEAAEEKYAQSKRELDEVSRAFSCFRLKGTVGGEQVLTWIWCDRLSSRWRVSRGLRSRIWYEGLGRGMTGTSLFPNTSLHSSTAPDCMYPDV